MPDQFPSPRKFGVEHDEWRPNQQKALQDILDVKESQTDATIFLELNTGSGKSAIGTALGKDSRVLVLCHTLGLLDQYEKKYKFTIVKGRQEYPCVLSQKVIQWKRDYGREPTAADCHFVPMHNCPVAEACPYLNAKSQAAAADRTACTYRYAALSGMIKQRGGVVVCDEGHDANEELVKFNSFDVTYKLMDDYSLDPFPFREYEDILSDEDVGKVKDWLHTASLMIYIPDEQASDDAGARRKRLYKRFERMVEQIGSVKWFLEVLDDRIRLQALSARHVIADIFQNKGLKLFMSATFGNPQPLARELGVEDYHFFSYPHPIPPENRPIYDLGVPRMTKVVLDDNPLNFQKQAMAIWYWVKQMPVEWRGVILTTSYHKITFLERYLGHSVEQAGRRLIVQGAGEKVGDLVGHFISDVRDGDIAIGTIQGWGSGIDLYGDLARWVVVAGVPHVNPTDKFAKARRQISGGIAYQNWVTYNQVMQACGRVSRGERVGEEWLTNYAALADGSAMTSLALSHYGEWFRDALVTKQTIPEKLEHVI